MNLPEPDGSKQVLLVDHRDGQCRAIIGYVDGEASKAMYCGEVVTANVTPDGRVVQTSWCPYHRALYVDRPGNRQPSVFIRRPGSKEIGYSAGDRPLHKDTICAYCRRTFQTTNAQRQTCSEQCARMRRREASRESDRIRRLDPAFREKRILAGREWREKQKAAEATAASS